MSETPLQHSSDLRRYLAATIIPILLLTVSLSVYCYDQIQQYTLTRKEIKGVQSIRILYGGLTELQQIRGYTQISLWGHDEVNVKLKELKRQFLDRFQSRDWLMLVEHFGLQEEAGHLYDEARTLFLIDLADARSMDLFARYSKPISEILQLMQLASDHSNLILDPDLDTYYLIDILVRQIPYLDEAIGRVRGIGSGLIAKGEVSQGEIIQLQDHLVLIESKIKHVEEAQSIMAKTAAGVARRIDLLPPELDTVLQLLFSRCREIMDNKYPDTMNPENFFQVATEAIDLLYTPYQGGLVLLSSRLQEHRDSQLIRSMVIVMGTSVAIILMLYFNRSFYLYDRRLHEEMMELSITDQLTGLYNRRHFYDVFSRELRRSMRHGCRLYLVLLDVDYFKRYNDTYGHPKGDIVLRDIAGAMQNVLQRAGDFCFRVGGEEFCFFFVEQELNKAEALTDKVRQAIEKLGIPHAGNAPFGVVTVSLGLVEVPSDPDCSLETIMPEVDSALYRAKKAGRNQYKVGGKSNQG